MMYSLRIFFYKDKNIFFKFKKLELRILKTKDRILLVLEVEDNNYIKKK